MKNNNKTIIADKFKELVLARIKTMPADLRMSIGGAEFSRDDIAEHVEKRDELGKEIIQIQLEFLQNLASGTIYANP